MSDNLYASTASGQRLRRVLAAGFGNARFERTLFEQALNAQALRLAGVQGAELASLERDESITLRSEDLVAAARALGEEPVGPRRDSWWRWLAGSGEHR